MALPKDLAERVRMELDLRPLHSPESERDLTSRVVEAMRCLRHRERGLPDIAMHWPDDRIEGYLRDCAEAGADPMSCAHATGADKSAVVHAFALSFDEGPLRDIARNICVSSYRTSYAEVRQYLNNASEALLAFPAHVRKKVFDLMIESSRSNVDRDACHVLRWAEMVSENKTDLGSMNECHDDWRAEYDKRREILVEAGLAAPDGFWSSFCRHVRTELHAKIASGVLAEVGICAIPWHPDISDVRRLLADAEAARPRLHGVGAAARRLAENSTTIEHFVDTALHYQDLLDGGDGTLEDDDRALVPSDVVRRAHELLPHNVTFMRKLQRAGIDCFAGLSSMEPIETALEWIGARPTRDQLVALAVYVAESRPGHTLVVTPATDGVRLTVASLNEPGVRHIRVRSWWTPDYPEQYDSDESYKDGGSEFSDYDPD